MIRWNITEQQADQILNVLGQRPFVEVAGLIQNLLQQANQPKPPDVGMPEGPLTGLPNGAVQAPGGPLEAPAAG